MKITMDLPDDVIRVHLVLVEYDEPNNIIQTSNSLIDKPYNDAFYQFIKHSEEEK